MSSVDLSVPVEVRVMGSEPVAERVVEALRCALDVEDEGVRGPYPNRSRAGVRFYVTVRLPGESDASQDAAAFLSAEAFVAYLDSLGSETCQDGVRVGGRRG